jgi:hypothetical protein
MILETVHTPLLRDNALWRWIRDVQTFKAAPVTIVDVERIW